jgi:hypothetical protein
LAKAFDRLNWNFIASALARLDLHPNFISHIKACISTPTYSILLNSEPTTAFSSNRGIRQGCLLSPYLFIVAINELSIRLKHEMRSSNISSISLGPGCPLIQSLLFVDDLILCGATATEANNIRDILHHFCNLSGQTSNLQKSSILFNKDVPNSIKAQIKEIFPVPDLLPNTIHLGHPTFFNHRDRNKAYEFILNKFRAKLTTIKANKLNHAGRLTYIKSVLASILVYYMSTVVLQVICRQNDYHY